MSDLKTLSDAADTDPMEVNGRFIVELVNAYREGRLVEAQPF